MHNSFLYLCFTQLFIGAASAATVGVDSIAEGDLIVTEIMFNPSSTAWHRGQWFEIYNTSADTIDLQGLEIGDGAGQSETVTRPFCLTVETSVQKLRIGEDGPSSDDIKSNPLGRQPG